MAPPSTQLCKRDTRSSLDMALSSSTPIHHQVVPSSPPKVASTPPSAPPRQPITRSYQLHLPKSSQIYPVLSICIPPFGPNGHHFLPTVTYSNSLPPCHLLPPMILAAAAVTFQKANLIRSPPSSQNPSVLPPKLSPKMPMSGLCDSA